ncbi:MAG TPA: biotin synthase BioB [Lachnospiraceae bacterium]|nr:biotin synthase BioB [Lachnospiraceae bacterium]
MSERIVTYKNKIMGGYLLNREDALCLAEEPLDELETAANEIRKHFCGDIFDICTIINGKSGKCPENCKYCAQSVHHDTEVETYPLLPDEEIIREAARQSGRGVLRYSIVTSGRKLSDEEVDRLCGCAMKIRDSLPIRLCISGGLLSEKQFCRLREAGFSRAHNNMETSELFFPEICTTHTYGQKREAVRGARTAGLDVCSGGIIGLGETMADRIDMALEIRGQGVHSVPVNLLNPIPGTPLEHRERLSYDEFVRTVALFRFILPDSAIRLAGGRSLMPDQGRRCFLAGANAAISGDMLTTAGYTVETDLELIHSLGYKPGYLGD